MQTVGGGHLPRLLIRFRLAAFDRLLAHKSIATDALERRHVFSLLLAQPTESILTAFDRSATFVAGGIHLVQRRVDRRLA